MRIYLDNELFSGDAATVGDAIAICCTAAEQKGRCVVEVIVDGQSLTNEQLGQTEITNASAEEVRLISAEPKALVTQIFTDASEALNEARAFQDDAAALLQADDRKSAMDQLSEAFSIWMSVQQAILQGSQLLGMDLDRATVNDKPVVEHVAALGQQLEAIQGQLEHDDLVGVADTLLYDLPEVVDQWQQMLKSLQAMIQDVR